MAVDNHHKGWVAALPRIRFMMMNTVNTSTGYSGFYLRRWMSPRLIPPIIKDPIDDNNESPFQFVECLTLDVGTASDNLLNSKVNQSDQANKHRLPNILYSVGDQVLLSTKNLSVDEHGDLLPPTRKLRPKFVGPFKIRHVDFDHSTVSLEMPGPANKCKTFHFSLIKPYQAFLDDEDSTSPPPLNAQEPLPQPPVKITKTGNEHYIKDLIAHKRSGRGWCFLVRWQGFSEDHNECMTFSALKHTHALDNYLKRNGPLS
ncbi:hypothetical protein Agabi119p4_1367 [Agaricus bisporus var. burnettii]|uniref:Chromo domain-containing protein n=1 Tax=Agaricus bisporus var. burnettii TaxID=192524 RepID=A0A8H7KM80_AGABI|nr:hypothetical protein Agabi119p4_1367 [Agaricus bisporus var. burnettii]